MSCNTRQRAPLILVTLVVILMVLLALPAVAGAAVSYSAEELAFLSLINQHRQTNGLGTLMLSDVLSDSSDKHNLDMGHHDFFGHITQGSDYFAVGSSPWDRMADCGYDHNTAMGENIAVGQASAEAVFQLWKNSPGHNANMLNASFKVIGISLEVIQGSRYTYYWTTDFGGIGDTAFTDVQPQDRFYSEISTLAGASIVSGYADNLFRPENQVTRAQFAKIIMLALGKHTEAVEGIESPVFRDVVYTGQPYPFDFVQEAATLGIVEGNADGTFGPYQGLTRAQLALMLVRAGGAALSAPPAGFTLPFVDVPEYAKEAVAVAFYNQLVSGITDTTFDPYGLAARGQVAKMIYGLMERMRG